MTTATAAAYHEVAGSFTNKPEWYRFTYDFATDGGSNAHTAIYLGRFKKKGLILASLVHVETLCGSGGSATVEIGTTTDIDCIMNDTSGALANLVDDAVIKETAGQATHVHVDDYLYMDIAAADLTAGKFHVYVQYLQAA